MYFWNCLQQVSEFSYMQKWGSAKFIIQKISFGYTMHGTDMQSVQGYRLLQANLGVTRQMQPRSGWE